jgi:hypothetical protein
MAQPAPQFAAAPAFFGMTAFRSTPDNPQHRFLRANTYDFDTPKQVGAVMKPSSALVMILPLLAVQTAAVAHAKLLRQQEEFPPPTPLDDPYVPPAGDPDIFAPEDDDQGEAPSPLNPAGD